MAETLNDAVIRLRLDTKQAKKDAESLQGGTGEPGVTRPTPSAGGGRQGGGSRKPLFPPGATVNFDPETQTVTFGPSGSSPEPGASEIEDAPIPGKAKPKQREKKPSKSEDRLRRRVNRVEAQQAIGTLGTALASIPFAEIAGVGLAGAALVEQFGPGVAAGVADSIKRNIPGIPDAALEPLRQADALVEELSGLKSEITSAFAALAAAKVAVGASARIRELAGSDIDAGELAEIGLAEARVQRQLSKLRNRSDYIEREALGKAMGGGLLDKAFDMSMGK